MPTSFQPKFVDLVRNYTSTTGTTDFKLGTVANGFVSFTAACQVGDQFYYSAIGVDKPAEREVGRGTLLANGVISRDPISGTKTNFSIGTKSIALIAAAEWFSSVQAGNGALVAASNLADLQSAASARTNLGLGSAAVEAVDRFAVSIADRAALAAHSASSIAYLREPGREGAFVFDASDLSAKVAQDPQQGVYVPRSSDPTGASGAWVRADRLLHPKMFGAKADGATDDTAALNAFFAFMALYTGYRYKCSGDYAVSSGLVVDGGTYGTDTTFALDFGKCRLTATAAIQRMVTFQDCIQGEFSGHLHVRGTNYGNDSNTNWTCDVGVYVNNCSDSRMPFIYGEGFAVAAVDSEKTPSGNDDIYYPYIDAKRVGSGMPLASRSRSGTYSGAVQSGVDGSNVQYTQLTVTNLPPVYAQSVSTFVPNYSLILEIQGRPHLVNYLDAATNTVRVFPKLLDADLADGGAYKWHYGGVLLLRGNDSNLANIGVIHGVAVSTGVAMSCLYGARADIIHTEASGSSIRLGTTTSSPVFGCTIEMLYNEGNTWNVVNVAGVGHSQFRVGALPSQSATWSKWVSIECRTSATTYTRTPWSISPLSANGSPHERLRNYDITVNSLQAVDYIDFNQPRTFKGLVYQTNVGTDNAAFTLVAPDADLMHLMGYKVAKVTVMGRGTAGAISGAITFTPPSGHAINGAAADAVLTLAGGTYAGPVVLVIAYDGSTGWTIYPVPQGGGVPAGDLTITGKYITATSTNVGGGLGATRAYFGVNTTWGAYVQGNGSTNDFTIFNKSVGTVMGVPTGTVDCKFGGYIKSTSATAGVGYATGAGGTVAQATSKSTGVTLNTVCGQITMNAAALAAGAGVSFTITNSSVAATDTIDLILASGNASAGTYNYQVDKISAGSFVVWVKNISGGSLSEALVFNFSVKKAVTS